MFATMSNPAAAYRKAGVETQVETASPHMLVLMLFEGAIRYVNDAASYIRAKDVSRKAESITSAIDVIDRGLKACLDRSAGGQLSERLEALYEYMCVRLLYANLHNDQKALEEVTKLLGELHGAWKEIANDPAVVSFTRADS